MLELSEEQLKEYRFVVDNHGYNPKLYQLVSREFEDYQNKENLMRLGFNDEYANKVIQWWSLRSNHAS